MRPRREPRDRACSPRRRWRKGQPSFSVRPRTQVSARSQAPSRLHLAAPLGPTSARDLERAAIFHRAIAHLEHGVVKHDRVLDADSKANLDSSADADVRANLGRRVDLGRLVDEARLDNLGARLARGGGLGRVVCARVAHDGRRAAAEQERVRRLVRREDEAVGGNGGSVIKKSQNSERDARCATTYAALLIWTQGEVVW